MPAEDNDTYNLTPWVLLGLGTGSMASGAAVATAIRWRKDAKELQAEGIDPRVRSRVLPHALKALIGSLFLTGCAAAGGFYVLQAAGMVAQDRTRVATLSRTYETLRGQEKGDK